MYSDFFTHQIETISTNLIIFPFIMTVHIKKYNPQCETFLICPTACNVMCQNLNMKFHSTASKDFVETQNISSCIVFQIVICVSITNECYILEIPP
jgi:hypothetical protein